MRPHGQHPLMLAALLFVIAWLVFVITLITVTRFQ